MYRIKFMTELRWKLFQPQLIRVFQIVLTSRGRIAVFVEQIEPGGPRSILIPEYKSYLVEALTPGDWQDCSDISSHRWELLAGTTGSLLDLNVQANMSCETATHRHQNANDTRVDWPSIDPLGAGIFQLN